MNKICIVICAMVVSSCSNHGSDIASVKSGVLDFNKTLTVGQALDNWQNCNNSQWSNFTSSNGVNVVQFVCDVKVKEYGDKLKSIFPDVNSESNRFLSSIPASYIETFQFTINKDDTFQISDVTDHQTWSDGTENEENMNPMDQLKAAYSNVMAFDVSSIKDLQPGNSDSESAATMILGNFLILKAVATPQKQAQAATPQHSPQDSSKSAQNVDNASTTAQTLVDSDGIQYIVKDDPAGKLLESSKATIILGTKCSASSPQYGKGKWSWANGGITVEFDQTKIGFPREETPYDDSRCSDE